MSNEKVEEDIFKGLGVEIELGDPENFLKIKETLTRIGVASKIAPTLYQSCHILHKRDLTGASRYAIVHFKEMFKLDGKPSTLTEIDIARRNAIVKLLDEWKLLSIVNEETIGKVASMTSIKVISHKDKSNWNLVAKYQIGRK